MKNNISDVLHIVMYVLDFIVVASLLFALFIEKWGQ